jgi:hypothetical protein
MKASQAAVFEEPSCNSIRSGPCPNGDVRPRLPPPKKPANLVLSQAALLPLSEIGLLYDMSLPDLLHQAINMALAHYGHPSISSEALVTLE